MKFLRFTKKNILLLFEMEKKGTITAREQTIYSPFAFYLNIGVLKELGLIKEIYTDGNKKYWALTKKGNEFVKHIRIVEGVLDG